MRILRAALASLLAGVIAASPVAAGVAAERYAQAQVNMPAYQRRFILRVSPQAHSLAGVLASDDLGTYLGNLNSRAQIVLNDLSSPQGESLSIAAIDELRAHLSDATRALEDASFAKDDPQVTGLRAKLIKIERAFVERSELLAGEALQELAVPGAAEQFGRTHVVSSRENGAVAFKFNDPDKPIAGESEKLREFRDSGRPKPIALPHSRGFIRDGDADPAQDPKRKFSLYFMPEGMAREYFWYLGHEVPRSRLERVLPWVGRQQRLADLRKCLMTAVDDIAQLYADGLVHGSLAPMSHSTTRWDATFHRSNAANQSIEIPRDGSTSIFDWSIGLKFPNVRLNGLANPAYIGPLPTDAAAREKALAQNIFELLMLALRHGYINSLGVGPVRELLSETCQSLASKLAGPSRVDIDLRALKTYLKSALRRHYGFYWYAARISDEKRRLIHKKISDVSAAPVPEGAELVMPGELLHPLIANVVLPLAGAIVGGSTQAKPAWMQFQMTSWMRACTAFKIKSPLISKWFREKWFFAFLFGFDSAAYLGRFGRWRNPWIWRSNMDWNALMEIRLRQSVRVAMEPSPRLIARILSSGSAAAVEELKEWEEFRLRPWKQIGPFLRHRSVEVRRGAATAIANKIGTPLDLIKLMIADRDEKVRAICAAALAGSIVRDNTIVEYIHELWRSAKINDKVAAATASNGNLFTGEVIAEGYAHPNQDVRWAIFKSHRRRPDAPLDLIERAVFSGNAEDMNAGRTALFASQNPDRYRLIEKMLRSADTANQNLAVSYLEAAENPPFDAIALGLGVAAQILRARSQTPDSVLDRVVEVEKVPLEPDDGADTSVSVARFKVWQEENAIVKGWSSYPKNFLPLSPRHDNPSWKRIPSASGGKNRSKEIGLWPHLSGAKGLRR